MADEIADQNRISVWRLPNGLWAARIGPADGRGVEKTGANPAHLLFSLCMDIISGGWIFDYSWKPKPQ